MLTQNNFLLAFGLLLLSFYGYYWTSHDKKNFKIETHNQYQIGFAKEFKGFVEWLNVIYALISVRISR